MWPFWKKKQNNENDHLTSSQENSIEQSAEMKSTLESAVDTQVQTLMQQVDLCLEQSPEQALELLDEAIALTPENPSLWEKQGLALQKLGRIEEAIASNQKAMQLMSQIGDNFDRLSNGLRLSNAEKFQTDDSPDLSLPLKVITNTNKQQAHVYFETGNQFMASGQYSQAIDNYQRAISINPNFFQAWSNHGTALSNLDRHEEAIASYDKALELNPDAYDVWYNRGTTLQDLGRSEEAHASFDIAYKINPDLKQELCFKKVFQLFYAQRFEEALDGCIKALEQWPTWDQLLLIKGQILNQLGRDLEAIDSFEKVLEINPSCFEAWVSLGVCLGRNQRYQDAIEKLNEALLLRQDDSFTWYQRGYYLTSIGKYEDAITSFDQSIICDPNALDALQERAYALWILGQFDAAIAAFEEVIKLKPDAYRAWYNKGENLIQIKRYEEAIESFEQAIKIQPDFFQAWINRGIATFYQRGYREQCAALLEGIRSFNVKSFAWGKLQQALGNAHWRESRRTKNKLRPHSSVLNQALICFQAALETFESENLLTEQLEVCQDYLSALIASNDIENTIRLRNKSLELFRKILNNAQTLAEKEKIEAKFSNLSQIEIDVLLFENEPILAFEAAERYKNRYLTQIFDTWQEKVISPSYAKMQEILNSGSAVVYWHLSPESLTTFILSSQKERPIVLSQSASFFKDWQRKWDMSYGDYRSIGKEQTSDKKNHLWRTTLQSALAQLKVILQIEQIDALLPTDIPILLVPHRDLHRFPIHVLFTDRTCTYCPSIQVALSQQPHPPSNFLLNIHDPKCPEQAELEFASLESAVIEAMFAPQVRSIPRDFADLTTVQSALESHHGICHFTGHGEYQSANPENSSLGLANQDLLTTKDIAALDLNNYHLVCLSACETALTGTQMIYRDYIGLASAFLQAGVSQVISTCWTVPEISSTFLMICFYQFLQQYDVASALQQAQNWLSQAPASELADWLDELVQTYDTCLDPLIIQELQQQAYHFRNKENDSTIDSHTPPFADPYHWAAFTLTGRGSR